MKSIQATADSENEDSQSLAAPPVEDGRIWAMFDQAWERIRATRTSTADAHVEI